MIHMQSVLVVIHGLACLPMRPFPAAAPQRCPERECGRTRRPCLPVRLDTQGENDYCNPVAFASKGSNIAGHSKPAPFLALGDVAGCLSRPPPACFCCGTKPSSSPFFAHLPALGVAPPFSRSASRHISLPGLLSAARRPCCTLYSDDHHRHSRRRRHRRPRS